MKRKNRLDEMELELWMKSMVCAYKFILIILGIWIIAGIFLKYSVVLPGYILIGQAVIRFIAEQIYKRNAEDDRWKRNVIIFLIIGALIIFLILLIPAASIGIGEM